MSQYYDGDLQALKLKLNALGMYDWDRATAINALRTGFVIVDRAAWVAQRIRNFRTLFTKPVLAR